MSEFGKRIITTVLFPFTMGLLFLLNGVRGVLEKENLLMNCIKILLGLFFCVGTVWRLLFNSDISMYT